MCCVHARKGWSRRSRSTVLFGRWPEKAVSDAQEPAREGLGEGRPRQRAGPGPWHVN